MERQPTVGARFVRTLAWMPDSVRDRARGLYLPADHPQRVQVLGAGRAGRAFAAALRGAGVGVAVWNRSDSPHADSSGALPDLATSDTWLVCIADAGLPELASQLAAHPAATSGRVALHCAGRFGAEVFGPLGERGMATGALHPLQSLRGDGGDRLDGSFCAVCGDPEAVARAEALVQVFGGRPVALPEDGKAAYHAAAVLAANFATTLGAGGVALLSALGVPPTTARDMLVPLLRGTVDHFAISGAAQALTGPFARGDLEAVAVHVAALEERAPAWLEVYAAMARGTARWLEWRPEKTAALEVALAGASKKSPA